MYAQPGGTEQRAAGCSVVPASPDPAVAAAARSVMKHTFVSAVHIETGEAHPRRDQVQAEAHPAAEEGQVMLQEDQMMEHAASAASKDMPAAKVKVMNFPVLSCSPASYSSPVNDRLNPIQPAEMVATRFHRHKVCRMQSEGRISAPEATSFPGSSHRAGHLSGRNHRVVPLESAASMSGCIPSSVDRLRRSEDGQSPKTVRDDQPSRRLLKGSAMTLLPLTV